MPLLIWLVILGNLDGFILHSKIRGHTYFSTDRASGPFKRNLDKVNIYSTNDIARVALQTFDACVEPDSQFFRNYKGW
jgi:hypothetical protein